LYLENSKIITFTRKTIPLYLESSKIITFTRKLYHYTLKADISKGQSYKETIPLYLENSKIITFTRKVMKESSMFVSFLGFSILIEKIFFILRRNVETEKKVIL